MNIIKKTCYTLIIFALITAFFFSYAFIGKVNADYDGTGEIDLTENGAEVYSYYSADKIVERLLQKDISASEKQLLGSLGEVLKYNDLIPLSDIKPVSGEHFFVSAKSYSYTTGNGVVVVWNPYSATFGGECVLFTQVKDDLFSCEFTDTSVVENDQDKLIDVEYRARVTLSKDFVNGYLNYAENYVKNQVPEKTREKYLQDKLSWDERYLSWQKYQEQYSQYQKDLKEYNDYLVVKKRWNDSNSAYLQYLEQLKAYNAYQTYLLDRENYITQLALYNDYVIKYADYTATVKKIEEENKDYFEQMEKINYILYVVGLINEPMGSVDDGDGKTSQRTLYGAVTGSTVTSVLAQRADLDKLGVDSKIIDIAEEATYKLREMFTAYFKYTEDADKYAYYYRYRSDLCNNLRKLFISLEKLERNSTVSDMIKKKGKTEQYNILLSQLSVITRALDDKPLYNYESYLNGNIATTPKLTNSGAKLIDSDWKVDGKRTADAILGKVYVEDFSVSCKPSVNVYPPAIVYPEEPTKVDCPVAPTVVSPVDMPKAVDEPGEPPKEINEPNQPQFVENPGNEPTEYVIPEFYDGLVSDYKAGSLTRTPYSSDVDFDLICQIQKQCGEILQLTFYDENGSTLLYETEIIKSGNVVYPTTPPQKEQTAKYVYEFECWKYSDGTVLDMKKVQNGGNVYASYKQSLREYNIVFNIDGEKIVKTYHYQDIPELEFTPYKEAKGNIEYEFIGWGKEIVPVTQNDEYVAVFKENKIVCDSFGGGNAEIKYSDGEYCVVCGFTFSEVVKIEKLLKYAAKEDCYGDSSSVKITDSDGCVIWLSKDCVKTLFVLKAYTVELFVDYTGKDSYAINMVIFNSEENELSCDESVKIKLKGNFVSEELSLYLNNANQTAVEFGILEDELSFQYTVGKSYKYCIKYYSVTVSPSDFVTVSANIGSAKAGEIVKILLGEIKPGVKLKNVYATNSIGQQLEISEDDMSFIMPSDNVTVGVVCEEIYYVVSFAWDDGTPIRTTRYKYGDTVEVPTAPFKMSTDEYMYVFTGWDKRVVPVTEDVTYYAVFSESKILSNGMKYSVSKILLIEIGVGVLAVVLTITIIVVVAKMKSKKKSRKK